MVLLRVHLPTLARGIVSFNAIPSVVDVLLQFTLEMKNLRHKYRRITLEEKWKKSITVKSLLSDFFFPETVTSSNQCQI